MLGVVIIVTLQFDLNITRRKLFLLLMGSCVGTGLALALIACNFTNVWLYLSAIFILTFFMGYVLHGPDTRTFFGLFTLLTFLGGVTTGMGPIQDWRASLILLSELTVAGLLLWVFLVWIWPFTPAKIFRHSQLQIQWHQDLIKKNLCAANDLRSEFNALRREIRTFYNLTWRDESLRKKSLNLAVLYYRDYHLMAGLDLLLQHLDLAQIDPKLNSLLEKTLSLPDPNLLNQLLDELEKYMQDCRQKFLQGDRLPFCYGVKITHLTSLLAKLVQCQKEIAAS